MKFQRYLDVLAVSPGPRGPLRGAVCLLAVALSIVPSLAAQEESLGFRRIYADPSRLPDLLPKQLDYQAVPREQFEAAVRRAAAADSARAGPQLLEANFVATWQEGHLVGTATFRLAAPRPGVFFMQAAGLALRRPVELDSQPAIAGEWFPGLTGVVLEREGRRTLTWGWSARGEPRPDGVWFQLSLPAAPVGSMTVDLPSHLWLDSPSHRHIIALAGAGPGGGRRWQVPLGGRAAGEVTLLARPQPSGMGPSSSRALVRQVAEYDLSAAGGTARFQCEIEPLGDQPREASFELPAEFDPTDVSGQSPANMISWQVRMESGSRILHVTSREPWDRRSNFQIQGRVSPPPSAGQTVGRSVGVLRPRGLLRGQESIRVRLAPGVSWAGWDFGDYRPESVQEERVGGWPALTLVPRAPNVGPQVRPPIVRLAFGTADFAVQQQVWWRPEPRQSRLNARVGVKVRQGQLFNLALGLPAGWRIDDVIAEATRLDWSVTPTPTGDLLNVDVPAGIDPRTPLEFMVELRAAGWDGRTRLAVPTLQPHGAAFVATAVGVSLAPPGQPSRHPVTRIVNSSGDPAVPRSTGPWGNHPLDHYLVMHGFGPGGFLEADASSGQPTIGKAGWVPEADARLTPEKRATDEATRRHLAPPVEAATLLFQFTGRGDVTAELRWLSRADSPAVRLRLPAGARLVRLRREGVELTAATDSDGWVTVAASQVPALHELTYETPGTPGAVLSCQALPEPEWEAGSVAVRRFLALPASWRPLFGGRMATVPVGPWDDRRSVSESLVRSLRSLWGGHESGWDIAEVRRHVQAAVATLPLESDPEADQAAWVVALQEALRPLRLAVVVDRSALAAEGHPGLGRRGPPPLAGTEGLALGILPWSGGCLITSRRQAEVWETAPGGWPGPILKAGLDEAVRTGRDVSGRFWGAPEILLEGPGPVLPPPLPSDLGAGSGLWELDPSTPDDPEVWLVEERTSWLAGLVCAVALLPLCLAHGRRAAAARVAIVGLSLVGGFWLPDGLASAAYWPLASASVTIVLSRTGTGSAPRLREPSTRRAVAAAFALLLVLAPGVARGTVAGDLWYVFILPARPGEGGGETALVPAEFWRRLGDADRQRGGLPPYAWLEGDYAVRAQGGLAHVTARLHLYVFQDQPVTATVPTANARLVNILLDSAPTLALPLHGQEGLSVTIQGRGHHVLQLTWESTVKVQSGRRELLCRIPPLGASRLTFVTGASEGPAYSPVARGGQWLEEAGGELRLTADLGRVADLHVRWGGAVARPVVRLRETHLWTLRPRESTLESLLRCNVVSGLAEVVRLVVPPGLEVRSVEAAGEPGAEETPRLAGWSLAPESGGRDRVLTVRLQRPIAGRFRVLIEFLPRWFEPAGWGEVARAEALLGTVGPHVPRLALAAGYLERERPAAAQVMLPLPTTLGVEREEAVVAAWAVELQASWTAPGRAWEAAPVARFTAGWPADRGPLTALEHVWELRPEATGSLLGRLGPVDTGLKASQALRLELRRHEVELQADLELTAAGPIPTVLEWVVPEEVMVADVQGEAVERWSRQPGTVQLWLRPGREGPLRLRLTGWIRTEPGATGETSTRLPELRLTDAAGMATQISLIPRGSLAVQVVSPRGLKAEAVAGSPGRGDSTYRTTAADYGGVLLIRTTPPQLRIDVVVELTTERPPRPRMIVNLSVESVPSEGLPLRLRDLPPGTTWEVRGDGVTLLDDRAQGDSGRDLRLRLPDQPGTYRLILNGSPAAASAERIPIPRVEMPDSPPVSRRLGPVPPGWRIEPPEAGAGAKATDAPADWVRSEHVPAGQVGVLYSECESGLSSLGWRHSLRYVLAHPEGGELHFRIPEAFALESAECDGQPLTAPDSVGRMTLFATDKPRSLLRVVLLSKANQGPGTVPPHLEFDGARDRDRLQAWLLTVPGPAGRPRPARHPAWRALERAQGEIRFLQSFRDRVETVRANEQSCSARGAARALQAAAWFLELAGEDPAAVRRLSSLERDLKSLNVAAIGAKGNSDHLVLEPARQDPFVPPGYRVVVADAVDGGVPAELLRAGPASRLAAPTLISVLVLGVTVLASLWSLRRLSPRHFVGLAGLCLVAGGGTWLWLGLGAVGSLILMASGLALAATMLWPHKPELPQDVEVSGAARTST